MNELISSNLLKTVIALKDVKLKDLAKKLNVHPSYISLILKDKKKEHCRAILLNSRNQVINVVEVSIGSLNANIVHPREVFKEAIRASAASIILIHNHPSGDLRPSNDDLELTKRLIKAGKLLGINVLDHIIISREGFLSFKRKGLI